MLKYYSAIDYSDELKAFLKRNEMLTTGDVFEVEIRAASILACHVSEFYTFLNSSFSL